jgi:hypothetical protein
MGRGNLATAPSLTTVYPVPNATRALVKCIDLANTTAAPLTVTVYLVPFGGTAGSDNALLPTVTVNGNTSLQWTGIQVLNDGDSIQASASATGMTINVSGAEAT